ncbi:TATA-binding protein-associated factor 172 [Coccomyxa sp. Obi]|nr:TATA-binding protein-associated factor 172 [Coccomyxa sp. Obi]
MAEAGASTSSWIPQEAIITLRLYFPCLQIRPLLQHKRWETRTAAGECIGLIAQHAQHATPADMQAAAAGDSDSFSTGPVKVEAGSAASNGMEAAEGTLSLDTFDLDRVLSVGTPLLASGGQANSLAFTTLNEFDVSDDPKLSQSERLAKQRKNLKSRLGLGGPVDQLMDTAELIKDEDLVLGPGPAAPSGKDQQKDASALISEMTGLSAREKNKLKRELKRKGSSTMQTQTSFGQTKRQKASAEAPAEALSMQDAASVAVEAAAAWQDTLSGAWPFAALCEQLCVDILSPVWEARHGAAVALREILRSQAGSAGVIAPILDEPSGWMAPGGSGRPQLAPVTAADAAAAAAANQAWLEDCALRLLCTLALDRFGDFVSDQVVAPVRETAAQALGAASRSLPSAKLGALACHLAALVRRPEWEVRLGGLLGLKYLLAARSDAATHLLPEALPAALAGLQDSEDDVRAVSAEALLPVADLLASQGGFDIAPLTSALWDALLDVDELSPSTGSVMQLLSQLQEAAKSGTIDSARLTQRLWPFFRHPIASVRLAAVRLFAELVVSPPGMQSHLLSALRELDADILDAFRALVRSAPDGALEGVISVDLLHSWFRLASTPAGQPLDSSLLLDTLQSLAGQDGKKGRKGAANGHGQTFQKPVYGGGEEDGSKANIMRNEVAMALGFLAAAWKPGSAILIEQLLQQMNVPRAASKVLCGLTTLHWAIQNKRLDPSAAQHLPSIIVDKLQTALVAPAVVAGPAGQVVYEEAAPYYEQLKGTTRTLCTALASAGYSRDQLFGGVPCEQALGQLNAGAAVALSGVVTADVAATNPVAAAAAAALAAAAAAVTSVEAFLHGSVTAILAAALVQAGHTPAKLNTIIQPLMGGLRRESDMTLRRTTAEALAAFVLACTDRTPSPNDRIVKNLCTMACGDPGDTPSASAPDPPPDSASEDPPASSTAHENGDKSQDQDGKLAAASLARQGAEAALQAFARAFGKHLLQKLPRLWEHASASIATNAAAAAPGHLSPPSAEPQAVIDTLQILKVLGPVLDAHLEPHLTSLMPGLASCCLHERRAVHKAAAACSEALASSRPSCVLPSLLRFVVPMLHGSAADAARQGAVAVMGRLIANLGLQLVPYANLLVVPLMGLTSDPLPPVRAAGTSAFAASVALLPLAQGLQPPEGLTEDQRVVWLRDAAFLSQLLDNTKVDEYTLPVEIRGELRSYQRAGISWLAFLRRCGLHGVLADDMGLGKTLQATAIVAACQVEQKRDGLPHKPSLIVCPPTLVGHWPHEIAKFVGEDVLSVVQYEGTPPARCALRERSRAADVVVMSYETLRADADWTSANPWAYCVLDEGHVIRNPKSKLAQAVKRVIAQHRLILSGTPIQNNVLELWALFDFLMPDFLGSHAAFHARYGRALAASRGSKAGSPEAQAGLLAMEGLHKQVMPFILRRTKDAVLKDLPPKILQDVYVEPSALQKRLYEDFSQSSASREVATLVTADDTDTSGRDEQATKAPHVFQALQYLRKLCSHPLLVLDPQVTQHVSAVAAVSKTGSTDSWHKPGSPLRQLCHAPKLAALRQLLQECGIISDADSDVKEEPETSEGAGHRVLIFAQLKAFLDIVERDVLQPAGVSFLRLDGSVEAASRFGIVQRFNGDPSIPVMLLTTAVGGLGLNLTSADTVIFLEHDWNPMKDLQAMDRAHRLGQQRTVNVYRLLTRGTLEERIMGLQRFKLDVANAVVNADNASLATMNTTQVLDLLSLQNSSGDGQKADTSSGQGLEAGGAGGAAAAVGGRAGKGLKAMLEGLGELWDENQYAEERSLDAFVSKLK